MKIQAAVLPETAADIQVGDLELAEPHAGEVLAEPGIVVNDEGARRAL